MTSTIFFLFSVKNIRTKDSSADKWVNTPTVPHCIVGFQVSLCIYCYLRTRKDIREISQWKTVHQLRDKPAGPRRAKSSLPRVNQRISENNNTLPYPDSLPLAPDPRRVPSHAALHGERQGCFHFWASFSLVLSSPSDILFHSSRTLLNLSLWSGNHNCMKSLISHGFVKILL